jgi:PAS domain S-box-containing protein
MRSGRRIGHLVERAGRGGGHTMPRTDPTMRAQPRADRRVAPPERRAASAVLHASAALLKSQNQVLELVARGAPLAETLDVFLRAIEAQSPGMLTSILLLDEDGVHVRHVAAPSLPESYLHAVDGEPIGPNAGSCGTAAYRREPVIVADIATDTLWDGYRQLALSHGLRACWSTPILDGPHRVLGTFAMYFRMPGRPTARHRHLIEVTTYTAAIAIGAHRHRQERARREAQLEEAQRLAQLGSYDWDVRTNTAQRSAELCRIFGLRPEQFAPTFEAYLERVHPADRAQTREIVERAARERTPFDFEERIVRPDGAVRYLRSRGKWLTDAVGEPSKLVGICQDITERKQAEEHQRRSEELRIRNEELKAFAYMVSHDLKGPIRGIAGYARELSRRHRDGLGERGARCVDAIVAAVKDLDALIEDLLQCSRLDAEPATSSDVDLAQIVGSIVRDRHSAIASHGVDLSIELAATEIKGWERGLTQVLGNLIDNALKFSKHARPPRVRIRSERTGDGVRISVTDNGIGFDMAHHDRIFGLFSRLVGHDEFEGTGAGLAIVKKIVDRIGGRVFARSTPGVETEFVVELPDSRD